MTCRALRPRGRPTPLPNTRCRMVSSGQIKPSTIPQCTLTGLYHFSPKAYGLSPLCLRLTSRVTHTGSRLDTKRGGSPLLGRHFQPLVNTAPRGAQLVEERVTPTPPHLEPIVPNSGNRLKTKSFTSLHGEIRTTHTISSHGFPSIQRVETCGQRLCHKQMQQAVELLDVVACR